MTVSSVGFCSTYAKKYTDAYKRALNGSTYELLCLWNV